MALLSQYFRKWTCDFENDCLDNSDENKQMCKDSFRGCSESEHMCNNKKCIPNRWKCDLDDDCGDNSDETDCKEHTCKVRSKTL